jgi:Tfp pilus assembly protein PilF
VWSKGEPDEAEKLFKRAIDAEPKTPGANRALAMFYLVRNRAAEAEPYLKTVAKSAIDRNRSLRWPNTTSVLNVR